MAEPTPLEDLAVNRRFWLGLGRKLTEENATRRDTAADKLITAITWFWTVYTAAAVVGVALSDRDLSGLTGFFIALPAVLLVAAYVAAVWVHIPVNRKIDARIPEEVDQFHAYMTGEKRKRLGWATTITGLAALSLVGAVIATAASDPKGEIVFKAEHVLQGTNSIVLISGRFEADQAVTATVTPGKGASTDAVPATELFTASSTGLLRGALDPIGTAETYTVKAEWSEEDSTRSISIAIEA
jgi:hypothetical protein